MARANRIAATEIHRLEGSVDFPPGHAAAYLVPAPEPILFDAGTLGSAGERELADELAAHGYEPADVDHLVLTHPHVDHIGQVTQLREAADPTIYVPTTFEEYLRRDVEAIRRASRANLLAAGVEEAIIDRLLPEFCRAEEIIRDILRFDAIDVWLPPGESATVGSLAVEPIHAPGHHRTHVCYATDLQDERVLFSGDMVIEPFRAATVHAGFDDGVADGVDAYLRGLERLSACDVDRVFPGHGPVHVDADGAVERAIDDLERRVDACASKLRPGGSTPLHVAGNLSSDERDVGRILPEVIAGLATLERRDRARSWLEDGVRHYEPA